MKTITITVKRRDVMKPRTTLPCPIDLATQRCLPACTASTGFREITVFAGGVGIYDIKLPFAARKFVRDHDEGRTLKLPFSFRVRIPNRLWKHL